MSRLHGQKITQVSGVPAHALHDERQLRHLMMKYKSESKKKFKRVIRDMDMKDAMRDALIDDEEEEE